MEGAIVRPKALALAMIFTSLVMSAFASDGGFSCNCDDEGFWSVQGILECQKVSDFLIAVAYFSIPIELLYFVSFSNVPFKWVLVQFIAFIVLCGLTHLLNGWTYYGPHSFQLMMSLTIAKFLTALVSCATAITLLTLIPLLLKIKVRELFLRQSVLELDQEVDMMKRQKETSWHVRMLTQEIRKSLDKHTILYTTLVELSKTLDLHNCVVWMPNENRAEMNLTHELKSSSSKSYRRSISIYDPDVKEIRENKGVRVLRPDSALAGANSGMPDEMGAVLGIRMPILQASNFKGGTPEFVDTNYAILVLVLPSANSRDWDYQEMEIVEVVADQVAVALSHAAVLEESQLMRDKLAEQNLALQQARKNAMMANQARNSFQKVMSNGMRRPMHSIMGILSILQQEVAASDQKLIIDTMTKTSNVLSTLINDVMEIPAKDDGKFLFDTRPFHLHSLIKEASCLAKCLCIYKGFGFSVNIQRSLPDQLMGDERRTFQVILHMVGYLLDIHDGGGSVNFRVSLASESEGKNPGMRGLVLASECIYVKFEFEISSCDSGSDISDPTADNAVTSCSRNDKKEALSFSVCRKLVQMMQGNIWIDSNSQGVLEKMSLVLRFGMQPAWGRALLPQEIILERQTLSSQFRNLRVLVADDDDINRMVTKKLLQKLGCLVTAVSSGFECLSATSHAENSFRIVILDLHLHDLDGFEVAMRIRKFRSRNWPIIIALTASTEERIRDKCIQMGMNGVIRKPVVLQGMADELRRHLQWAGEAV